MSEPGNDTVELVVDPQLCVGIGMCEMMAPTVFRVNDDGVADVVHPGRLRADEAQKVIEACPSGAITVRIGAP